MEKAINGNRQNKQKTYENGLKYFNFIDVLHGCLHIFPVYFLVQNTQEFLLTCRRGLEY